MSSEVDVDFFRRAKKAIQRGNVFALNAASRQCPEFPYGNDPDYGERWIIHAIIYDAVGALRWIIERGVSVDLRNGEGLSPLHACIEHARPKKAMILQMLLNAGADVNQVGFHGWTPLHLAAVRNDADVIDLLLEAGADIELKSEAGLTALQEAKAVGSQAAVDTLNNWTRRPLI